MCNPTNSNSNGVGDAGKFVMLDFCPSPSCQNVGPGYDVLIDNQPMPAFWPCGGGGGAVFDTQYPAGSQVTCGALQIISSGLDVFHAFVEIFTQTIFVPTDGATKRDVSRTRNVKQKGAGFSAPGRRESRQSFNARIRAWKQPHTRNRRFDGTTYGQETPGANSAEVIVAAIYDYDTSDCYSDPVRCHCRNLDLEGHCIVDEWGNVVYGNKRRRTVRHENGTVTTRIDPMTPADVTQLMSDEHFIGTSVCDHTVASVAGLDWDADPGVTKSRKNQYVKCLDKMIQGSRMTTVNEVFPADITYNSQSPVQMVRNVFHGFRQQVAKRHAELQRSHMEPRNPKTGARIESTREEEERLFPNWGQKLHEREQFARRVLTQELRIPPTHIMFDAILKFDRMYFKYSTGYYKWAFTKVSDVLARGDLAFPSTHDALSEVADSIADMRRIIWHQPYRELADATATSVGMVYRATRTVLEEGPLRFVKRVYGEGHKGRKTTHERNMGKRMEWFTRVMKASVFGRWWSQPPQGAGTNSTGQTAPQGPSFVSHMRHFIRFQRQHWQSLPPSAWTADLHYYSFRDAFLRRFEQPVWRPEQVRNWDRLRSFAYRMQEHIWPGSVSRELKERFLFNSNCVIVDRAVNVTLRVVDYCANEFIVNTRDDPSGTYWNDTSFFRAGVYHNHEGRATWRHERARSGTWKRPRRIAAPARPDPLIHRVDPRVVRARDTTFTTVHGPARWNLVYQVIAWVEDIVGYALGARSQTWFDDVQAWIRNPNTNVAQWPDVGLAYWLRFEFTCPFPEGLNCSIGIGLERALLWVTVGFVCVIVLGGMFFPPATIPFQIIGYPIAYVLVLFAVAFHTPAACMLIVPSFPLPFGIALPECLIDEVLAFFDKWISTCYVPLVIPLYMVSGDPCPTNGEIDVISCVYIGVSDGLQNILFAGYWAFGRPFADVVQAMGSTLFSPWAPGVYRYLVLTFDSFADAGPTQHDRQVLCFGATILAVAIPAIFVYVAWIVLWNLVPAMLNVGQSTAYVYTAFTDRGPAVERPPPMQPEEDVEPVPVRARAQPTWNTFVNRMLYGKQKVQ